MPVKYSKNGSLNGMSTKHKVGWTSGLKTIRNVSYIVKGKAHVPVSRLLSICQRQPKLRADQERSFETMPLRCSFE
jgi:hypothetical protein